MGKSLTVWEHELLTAKITIWIFIHEEDAAEVYDFIGYLNMKREREVIDQVDLGQFMEDKKLPQQIRKSQEDRKSGRIYNREQELEYLQNKIREFESE